MAKPVLLFIYDHFVPAARAGGIVRSLRNMLALLDQDFDVRVVTSAMEYGTGELLPVQTSCWVDFAGGKVMYLPAGRITVGQYRSLLVELKPRWMYLNGIFSPGFFIKPLLASRLERFHQVVIAPRGMLQQGALQVKALKKKLYLKALKSFFPLTRYRWHATDVTEEQDILRFLADPHCSVISAPVLPELPPEVRVPGRFRQVPEKLRVVTISLITEKKRILDAIRGIKQSSYPGNLEYHIYGPVKDQRYWKSCQEEIASEGNRVEIQYMGELKPDEVWQTLRQYHLYLLPTAGENFGHSIFEALATGTPVMISAFTPFTGVESRKAGWITNSAEKIAATVDKIGSLSDQDFEELSLNARKYAEDSYHEGNYLKLYHKLFDEQRRL